MSLGFQSNLLKMKVLQRNCRSQGDTHIKKLVASQLGDLGKI